MDARSLLSERDVAELLHIQQRGYVTVTKFWRDSYACWIVNRSAGWADGAGVEAQELVEAGVGKLYANGAGGPASQEGIVFPDSPYRFRTMATADIRSGNLLVINGDRLFRVDISKREHVDDLLMDVYLTELFTTPMPEAPPAPDPEGGA